MPYKYENGKWTYVAGDSSSSNNDRPSSSSSGSTNSSSNSSTNKPTSNNDNRETTETKTNSDKEYIDMEIAILEGSCSLPPDPKIKAKATVKFLGIGGQLEGLYFVDQCKHSFSTSGYTQELTVSREGFGDYIKKGNVSKPSVDNVDSNGRPDPVTPQENPEYILINKWGTVTPKIGLNCRKDPSTNNPPLGAMTKGTRVFCIGKKGAWYDHKWNGHTAWSHGDYIKLD